MSSNIIRYLGNEIPTASQDTKYTPQITSLPTNKLTLNQEYTYKELCTILDQPVKQGNSKKRHLTEFSRFFSYTKNKTKYKVIEIYPEPLPYLNNVSTSHKYNNDMIDLILAYIYSEGKEVLYLTHMDFILICGLANELYKKYGKEYKDLNKEYDISLDQISNFYSNSYHYFKGIITSALNSMQSRGMLFYFQTMIISETQKKNAVEADYILREATNEEVAVIADIQDKVLQALQLNDMNELWYRPAYRTAYNKKFKEELHKLRPTWNYCYKTFKIISSATAIRRRVDSNELRQSLNLKVFNFLHDKTIKQYRDMYAANILSHDKAEEWFNDQQTLEDKLIKLMSDK